MNNFDAKYKVQTQLKHLGTQDGLSNLDQVKPPTSASHITLLFFHETDAESPLAKDHTSEHTRGTAKKKITLFFLAIFVVCFCFVFFVGLLSPVTLYCSCELKDDIWLTAVTGG